MSGGKVFEMTVTPRENPRGTVRTIRLVANHPAHAIIKTRAQGWHVLEVREVGAGKREVG